MNTYTIREDGYDFAEIEAESASEALDIAEAGNNGDYDTSNGTVWVEWYAFREREPELTDEEKSAIPYDLTDAEDGYLTSIDHADHAGPCEDCPECDAELESIVDALPLGWIAEWTGGGNGTVSDVHIRLETPREWIEEESRTIQIDPEEPECTEGAAHDWQEPYEILGGLRENPGVHGHGGGVIMQSVCMHCGCERVTDTWAQNPANGIQGLTSVAYEPGKYAEEIAALNERSRGVSTIEIKSIDVAAFVALFDAGLLPTPTQTQVAP